MTKKNRVTDTPGGQRITANGSGIAPGRPRLRGDQTAADIQWADGVREGTPEDRPPHATKTGRENAPDCKDLRIGVPAALRGFRNRIGGFVPRGRTPGFS